MMAVTHGIVGSKVTAFRLEGTVLSIGDQVDVNLYGPIGSTVDIDYGNSTITTITLDVSPKTVVAQATGTDFIITSNTLENIRFATSNEVKTINIINGTSLNTLQSLAGSNATINSITIANCPNAFNYNAVGFNLINLSSFIVDDTSNVTNFVNAFNTTNLSETPILDYSSALDVSLMYANCDLITYTRNINTDVCLVFDSMFQNAVNLSCMQAINTLAQTSTLNMLDNTPALINPNATEQTAILAGSNYINAGACP